MNDTDVCQDVKERGHRSGVRELSKYVGNFMAVLVHVNS